MEKVNFLKAHCKFESDYDVYVLLAVARKKDHPELTNSKEIVFREVIRKEEDIVRKYNKLNSAIKNYTDEEGNKFSFYIYITMNPRNSKKAFFCLQNQINTMISESLNGIDNSKKFKRIDNMWTSALMSPKSRSGRGVFLIDLDSKNPDTYKQVITLVKKFTDPIIDTETKNGFHIFI